MGGRGGGREDSSGAIPGKMGEAAFILLRGGKRDHHPSRLVSSAGKGKEKVSSPGSARE